MSRNTRAAKLVFLLIAAVPGSGVFAHGVGLWGRPLDWHNEQIEQVIGSLARKVSVDGKECLAGGSLGFQVSDEYAFDIDETVWLDIEFQLEPEEVQLTVSYDSNNPKSNPLSGETRQIRLPKKTDAQWYRHSISLDRARFANLGLQGRDFSIAANDRPVSDLTKPKRSFTVCNIALRRGYTTPVAKAFGWAAIEIGDENDQPTPARMGIYDSSGRLPLPSDEAVTIKSGVAGRTRVLYVGSPWPVENRSVFYSDGRYHARLPVGEYDLVVAKGPEYRMTRQRFAVQANQTTLTKLKLRRWANLAANGWYSGEDHVHYARASEHDDRILQLFTQAENLNVTNILEFDDAVRRYFPHYDWKHVWPDRKVPFVLVPGQEAPRTTLLGHTTQLNIKKSIRNPEHYLLYHKVFEEARAQGGLAGFAHVVARPDLDPCYEPRGMPIDVAFGLVDFAEIFTNAPGTPSIWFDFLNLGYKISPTAGTDWPFGSVPGTARNYVKIDGPFTPQAWFDGIKNGRTFTTSGPMLELSVNGEGLGSEIRVKSGETLAIKAKASLNPDLGKLSWLELIEQGGPVKTTSSDAGAHELEFRFDVSAKHGTWFVLRARDKTGTVLALSAPIYVLVDGQSFWKPAEVPSIVAKLKSRMREILAPDRLESSCTEGWDTQAAITAGANSQRDALKRRIDQASDIYDDLARRAAMSSPPP